mmetsp:Transcript_26289/g.73412  ORF Transcript_26289/g.73412 Transcript_26289/m.73412 type:complete len:202 (+) Transcript_26289:963-1568(+)
MPDHVALDQLSIKQGPAHDASQESEVHQVVIGTRNVACRIDLHAHLVVDGRLPQTKVRVEYLFGNQLEPFTGNTSGIDTRLSKEFDAPSLSHFVTAQRHDGVDRIAEQGPSSDDDLDVALLPRGCELGADRLEPLRLLLERLALRGGNVGVAEQGLVLVDKPRIHVGVLGGNKIQESGPHLGVVAFQKCDLPHVCGLGKVE